MGIKEDVRASYTPGFRQRMRNWARSVLGMDSSFAQVNWDFTAGSTHDGPVIPILQGDAEDIGNALEKLPIRYRRAVELYWVWGDEDAELAVLGRKCAVDYRTFGHRVIDGHRLLRAEVLRAEEASRLQRERAEVAAERARMVGRVLT